MSKELKIGIISILTLAVSIWGFQYLKGRNLLKKGFSFTTTYNDVEGLQVASPIEINGLKIGAVKKIDLNPSNVNEMIVAFDIQGDFRLPDDTKAVLASDNSLVGSKKIILKFNRQCNGSDCLVGGERLQSDVRGFLDAIIGKDERAAFFATLRQEAGPLMDTILYRITDTNADNAISQSLVSMEAAMKNIASLTANLDQLLKQSYRNLNETTANLSVVTGTFAKSQDDLENLISNFSSFSKQLADADIGGTLSKTGTTMDSANGLLNDLQSSVANANESFNSLNSLLSKIDKGEGSVGQLLSNPDIYSNLEEATKHMSLLLQDFRLNPKRYVRLSVFGRKGNQYTMPQDDPAFNEAGVKN